MLSSPDAKAPVPVGPYSGGFTARISKIVGGAPVPVGSGLPASQTRSALGSLVSGVSDVALIGDQLYGLEAGAGCSHGLLGTDNTIFRVNPGGTTTTVANLSEFLKANPFTHPEEDDFEPDGTWYSMVAVRGSLYAVEPNHGEIDRVPNVRPRVDHRGRFPECKPSGHRHDRARRSLGCKDRGRNGSDDAVPDDDGPDGALYVSNLGFGVPIPGLGQILRITVPS